MGYGEAPQSTRTRLRNDAMMMMINSNLLKLAARKLNLQITICTDTVKYM